MAVSTFLKFRSLFISITLFSHIRKPAVTHRDIFRPGGLLLSDLWLEVAKHGSVYHDLLEKLATMQTDVVEIMTEARNRLARAFDIIKMCLDVPSETLSDALGFTITMGMGGRELARSMGELTTLEKPFIARTVHSATGQVLTFLSHHKFKFELAYSIVLKSYAWIQLEPAPREFWWEASVTHPGEEAWANSNFGHFLLLEFQYAPCEANWPVIWSSFRKDKQFCVAQIEHLFNHKLEELEPDMTVNPPSLPEHSTSSENRSETRRVRLENRPSKFDIHGVARSEGSYDERMDEWRARYGYNTSSITASSGTEPVQLIQQVLSESSSSSILDGSTFNAIAAVVDATIAKELRRGVIIPPKPDHMTLDAWFDWIKVSMHSDEEESEPIDLDVARVIPETPAGSVINVEEYVLLDEAPLAMRRRRIVISRDILDVVRQGYQLEVVSDDNDSEKVAQQLELSCRINDRWSQVNETYGITNVPLDFSGVFLTETRRGIMIKQGRRSVYRWDADLAMFNSCQ